MNWIRSDLEFGRPLKNFMFSGRDLLRLEVKQSDLFTDPPKAELLLTTLLTGPAKTPDTVRVVGVYRPSNRDVIVIQATDPSFPNVEGYDLIEEEWVDCTEYLVGHLEQKLESLKTQVEAQMISYHPYNPTNHAVCQYCILPIREEEERPSPNIAPRRP